MDVSFTTDGTFNAGNTFTAQLSNASGSFAAPLATATGTSPISLTVPTDATPGTGYKVRVVSSDPAVTGNEASLTVRAVPTLTTITPATTVAGSSDFTLTADGTGFISGATVYFNGSALTTTVVSATQLTAVVPASAVATQGVFPVTVKNTTGGAASNSKSFTVSSATANPTIAITQGGAPVANGDTYAGFAATTLGSNSLVTFSINNSSADDLTLGNFNFTGTEFALSGTKPTVVSAGTSATFDVQFTPSASGPRTGSVSIVNNSSANNPYVLNFSGQGNNPAPGITSLTPSTGATGSTIATLTIAGSNFVAGATVSFGGTVYTPATLSASQITVSNVVVPNSAGNVSVTVTNPTPGGGTSAAAVFTATIPNTACLSENFNSFTGGASVTLSSGIITTGLTNYTSTGSSGAAPNSAQFNSTGDQLETPTLSGPAASLSFFIKGNSTDAASSLLVEGWNGTSYVTIATVKPIPTTSTTITYNASSTPVLTSGTYTSFRFTYTKSNGNVAFDDLAVTCGPSGPKAVAGTISGSPFCVGQGGEAVSVPFTVTNGPFTAGNVFTAYISNDNFVTKTAIGTLAGTTDGTISGTIPVSVASGTTYRIRVDGSAPASTGTLSTTNLTVVNYLTNNVSGFSALGGDQQAQLAWTNPATCFSRVVIVARAGSAVTVKPTPDTPFTADAQFGSGTDLGSDPNAGQFVVYDGTGTSATITGLTNGTRYYFSAFVTNGGTSGYSNGVQSSTTPVPVVALVEEMLPQYLVGHAVGSTTHTTRLPYAYRATLTNLAPGATYRYYNTAVETIDGPTAGGAGVPIYPMAAGGFVRAASTSVDLNTSGNYGTFTASGSGSYTGWFVLEPTGNARFEDGDLVRMRIILNDGAEGTTAVSYLTTTTTVQVQALGSSSSQATGVAGQSDATASNFVFTYDNVAGTGRPLAGTYVESEGVTNSFFASFYTAQVDGVAGAWGTITPNNNANGIRRIAQYDLLTGTLAGCAATDADGTWGSGVVTASPAGGNTALAITRLDAPLTCDAYAGFASASATVKEGNTGTRTVSVKVTLTGTLDSPVTLSVTDAATGTATSGTDYVAFAPQELTFSSASTQTVTLTVNGDTDIEADETILLTLAKVSGGTVTLTGTTTTIIIQDNDQPSEENVLLLEENFDYAAGKVLTSTTAADAVTQWAAVANNGTNNITTVAGNLSLSGYPQGLAATNATGSTKVDLRTGQDINRRFLATTAPTQSIYASALVQVTSAPNTAGEYFLHFADATGSNFRGRVHVRQSTNDNTKINFGLDISSGTATYATDQFEVGVPYLVVLKYTTGATATTADDVASLYVLSSATSVSAEPTTPLVTEYSASTTGTAEVRSVSLRQGVTADAPSLSLDNLRVATGWGAVVGQVELTSPSVVNPGNYYTLALNGGNALATTAATGASNVTVEHELVLTDGVLTSAEPVKLTATASIIGGSDVSYVSGPLEQKKAVGAGTLVFPIGMNKEFRPLTLNITTQTQATTYLAKQQEGDTGIPLATTGTDLTRVSKIRSFAVTPTPEPAAGEFSGTITLSHNGAEDGVTDPSAASLVIAKSHAGGAWENIGQSATTATTVTSDPFTSFSVFLLASTEPVTSINPLPVQLTSFTAERNGSQVDVRWMTATEVNSARFDVERSADGVTFRSLGSRAAQGTTTARTAYRFLDAQPLAGTAYYRLKQVDHDGSLHYSEVRTILGGRSVAAVYPNPVQGKLNIQLPAQSGTVQAIIRDLSGREVYRATVPASQQLDVQQLPQGSYLLTLQGPQLNTTLKLVKTN